MKEILFFESYTEWIKFYLSEMGVEIKEVIFNTLSTPFLAIYHLPTLKKVFYFGKSNPWLYPRKYESHVITKPSKSICRYCS